MLKSPGENVALLLLGVLALCRGIYIVQEECPPNEEYLLCGTACPVNCSNLNDRIDCKDDCVEGCFCTAGLVRDDDGNCVKPDQCSPICKENEEFLTCGPACPANCWQPTPEPCNLACRAGCFCKEAYVIDETSGKCILVEDCADDPCLNENEVYDSCNGDCEPSCSDPVPICNRICMGGCVCSPGLLRNESGDCISMDKCPNGTEVVRLTKYLNALDKILNM